jgi:hypothetical protein
MSCISCNHRWCWVCGLPLSHWSHKLSEVLPLSCKRVPKSSLGWIGQFIIFLLGFIVLPILIFGIAFGGPVYGCIYEVLNSACIKRSCRIYGSCCCCFMKFTCFVIPFMIIMFCLGLAAGAVASVLATGLCTVPAYIFHTYYFVRSCYWWIKTSRVID